MARTPTLEDLYTEQLRELYDAELQLIPALARVAESAGDLLLREAFAAHLEVTRGQADRLEQLLEDLDAEPEGKSCEAMTGLIRECDKILKDDASPAIRDAALIVAAQRIEHYEMAGYGSVRTYATLLGDDEAAAVLQESLDEESDADLQLTEIADKLNVRAQALVARP